MKKKNFSIKNFVIQENMYYSIKIYLYLKSFCFHPRFFHVKKYNQKNALS